MNDSGTTVALTKENNAILQAMHAWGRYLMALVIVSAMLVLVGWQFNVEILKHFSPDLVVMNPVTALGFVFLGSSFLILDSKLRFVAAKTIGFCLILIPILIGIVRFLALKDVIDFQIDLTLFPDRLDADQMGNGPGRMATGSAVCFVLLGLAVISMHLGIRRGKAVSNYLSFVVFLVGLFKSIGYLYHVEGLFSLMIYDPMALRTAISLLVVSVALIIYNPTESYFSVIGSSNTGGTIARLLIPFSIIVPVTFGYIRLWLEWQHSIKVELGVTLLITAIVVTFLVLILFASQIINKKDILKKIAETKFEALLESAPDAMVIVDDSGIIKIVNAQAENLFQYRRSELLGRPVEILIPERFARIHRHHRTDFFANPKSRNIGAGLDLRGKKKDGTEFTIEISLSPLQTEKGMLVSAAIRDITERRLADDKLRFLASIADSIHDPVITSDLNAKVTRWNDAARELLGWTSEEAIGKDAAKTVRAVYLRESRSQIVEHLQRHKFWHGEVVLHAKSGRHVNVMATVSRLVDAKGLTTGHITLVRDITEQKEVEKALSKLNVDLEGRVAARTFELEKARHAVAELNVGLEQTINERTVQLESANKELESFSYSVAHDLRTPLRALAGYSTMLSEDYGSKFDKEGSRWLEELQYNSKKMGDLIDDLLTFSRLGRNPVIKSFVDMEGLVASVLNELSPSNAKILTGKLYPVLADGKLLRQVMINLLSNAIKYSSKKTFPVIEIFSEKTNDAVIYSVRDNGVGFEMEYANKLFGVFQRLHSEEEFHGTGVGLAIVQRIINRHDGKVWANAKFNEGATFCFLLPNIQLEALQDQTI
ncbi:MAG: PAS domain S-box protein [Bacteroidota bacterium]